VIDPRDVSAFLTGHRIALVGASDDKRSFGNTVYLALRDHGFDVVGVNPNTPTVAGDPCVRDLDAVTGELDGVMVMVNADAALDVVRAAIARGVRSIWLFKGLGAPGAVSDEAVKLCEESNVRVVAGACPLMFLEPVGGFHRTHRFFRHLNGSLGRAA
jgi:predicted CoA-binding protein